MDTFVRITSTVIIEEEAHKMLLFARSRRPRFGREVDIARWLE